MDFNLNLNTNSRLEIKKNCLQKIKNRMKILMIQMKRKNFPKTKMKNRNNELFLFESNFTYY